MYARLSEYLGRLYLELGMYVLGCYGYGNDKTKDVKERWVQRQRVLVRQTLSQQVWYAKCGNNIPKF